MRLSKTCALLYELLLVCIVSFDRFEVRPDISSHLFSVDVAEDWANSIIKQQTSS